MAKQKLNACSLYPPAAVIGCSCFGFGPRSPIATSRFATVSREYQAEVPGHRFYVDPRRDALEQVRPDDPGPADRAGSCCGSGPTW